MIIMDSVVIPRPPALPPLPPLAPPLPPPHQHKKKLTTPSLRSKSSENSGFRLMENQDDTGSVYSVYKQKIDSMFESDSSANNTKNSIQAKIEKMFSEVAKDNGINVINNVHSFSVDYLGSVPLAEKVTSLSGLQNPLRHLYFAYKKTTKPKKTLTGRLEISGQGLKVLYQGDKGDLEQLNSFPTIAVWSAVKFVIQENQKKKRYAFLPLITDPDNIDKKMLFKELDEQEIKYITNEAHSPLFAVVMRKIGVQKQLECHGFVCQTSEDAIVIAATLYKSLMAHMKAKEKKPKNRNGITCMSTTSSTINENKSNATPVRPPRKKRSTTSSVLSENDLNDTSDTQPLLKKNNPKKSMKTKRAPKVPDDIDAIVPYEEPIQPKPEEKPKTFSDKINTYMSREQKQITAEIKQVINEGGTSRLKPVSVRKIDDVAKEPRKENSGDILTKVTIPRSGSFLNAGGLTRYKSKVSRGSNGQGGSPLGFNELFNEFRLQEGLHSMDEILGVIIDPDGMSFNDLKPIYKEFLLKLSVTLTKDELYQRSKMIMRRHKKKLLRNNNNNNNNTKNKLLVSNKFKRLRHIFQKNFRLKTKKKPKEVPRLEECSEIQPETKLPESSISSSSYDTRHFTPKEEQKKGNYRKKSEVPRLSTSEESDFFSLRRKQTKSQLHQNNRNSSSGYVSCSECSYDSDTCTCISADKCYCSLGNKTTRNKNYQPKKTLGINSNVNNISNSVRCDCFDTSMSFCGCDTDSCTESNKCYCQTGARNQTILEQLHRRGLITEPLPPPPLPPLPPPQQQKHKKLCKKLSNSKSTRSLEYMSNPMESYYEKLHHKSKSVQGSRRRKSLNSDIGLDYELFSIRNRIYTADLNENRYKQTSIRSKGKSVQAVAPGASPEALSVKKSAEIAALFADIKLSQTTDIAHLGSRNYLDSIISSRNEYNRIKTQNMYHNTIYPPQKMVQNTLYSSSRNQINKMYSARNGLYTIQSQSDESRRSSISGDHPQKMGRNSTKQSTNKNQKVSTNLENSLGYLP